MYEFQIKNKRGFLHEHPNSASSWHVPEIVQFMNKYDLTKTTGHMCMYGMRGEDKTGEGPVKKPTGWLTNSEWIKSAMSIKCEGHHRHVQLMGGKASAARVYPDELCEAVVQGLKRQLTVDGELTDKNSIRQLMEDNILGLDEHQDGDLADGDYFLDDISGQEFKV